MKVTIQDFGFESPGEFLGFMIGRFQSITMHGRSIFIELLIAMMFSQYCADFREGEDEDPSVLKVPLDAADEVGSTMFNTLSRRHLTHRFAHMVMGVLLETWEGDNLLSVFTAKEVERGLSAQVSDPVKADLIDAAIGLMGTEMNNEDPRFDTEAKREAVRDKQVKEALGKIRKCLDTLDEEFVRAVFTMFNMRTDKILADARSEGFEGALARALRSGRINTLSDLFGSDEMPEA